MALVAVTPRSSIRTTLTTCMTGISIIRTEITSTSIASRSVTRIPMLARPDKPCQATNLDMSTALAAVTKRFPTGITSTTWLRVAYIIRMATTATTTDQSKWPSLPGATQLVLGHRTAGSLQLLYGDMNIDGFTDIVGLSLMQQVVPQ